MRVWSTWNDQVSNERSKIVRRVCRRCRERFQYSDLKVWFVIRRDPRSGRMPYRQVTKRSFVTEWKFSQRQKWNDQVSNERSKTVRRVCRRCKERFQYSVLKVWTISSLGLVAQLVRAPPCHGGGRRFESDLGRLYYEWGILAQLGEHLPYKQRVTGSSPVGPILLCINWICRCGSIGRAADL